MVGYDPRDPHDALRIFCPPGPYTITVPDWTLTQLEIARMDFSHFPIRIDHADPDNPDRFMYYTTNLEEALHMLGWISTLIHAGNDHEDPNHPVKIDPNVFRPEIYAKLFVYAIDVRRVITALEQQIAIQSPRVEDTKKQLDSLFDAWQHHINQARKTAEQAKETLDTMNKSDRTPTWRIARSNAERTRLNTTFTIEIDQLRMIANAVKRSGKIPDLD